MKVICVQCGKLVNESLAVKMSVAAHKSFEQGRLNIPFMCIMQSDYSIYTQICEKCYNSYKKDKRMKNKLDK